MKPLPTLLALIAACSLPLSGYGQDSFGLLRSKQFQQIGVVNDPGMDIGSTLMGSPDVIATPFVKTYTSFTQIQVYDPAGMWTPLQPHGDLWRASIFPAASPLISSGNWDFDTNNNMVADASMFASSFAPLPTNNTPFLQTNATDWSGNQYRLNILGNGHSFIWASNWAPTSQDSISFRILGMPSFDMTWQGNMINQRVLSGSELSLFTLGQTYMLEIEFTKSMNMGAHSGGGDLNGFYKLQNESSITRIEMIAVPEPSTWALLLLGTGTAALLFWRRRRQALAT